MLRAVRIPILFLNIYLHEKKFAIECKFRTQLNKQNQLEWSYPAQLKRYQEFAYQRKIPVYIVLGLEIDIENEDYDPDDQDSYIPEYVTEIFMFNIPLEEAKYPALYESVFAKYERDYEKAFFWKNGKLY